MLAFTILGLALLLLAGAVHVYIFMLEAPLFSSLGVKVFRVPAEDVAASRPWALNQGWYNLFLAIGAIGGSLLAMIGVLATESLGGFFGAALGIAVFVGAAMVGAAVVLVVSNRAQLRGALVQGVLPLIGLVLLAIGAVS